MNHDAKRATGAGGERHAIGVTSMCLRSGSVQLPYALAGRLPEGELLVHDVESDEALVLWSDPPRRLAGLGPLFERHEVQVNDQLVLDLHGDEVRLAVAKRPRRSRPKVTPSAWSSHRDEPPRRTAAGEEAVPDTGVGEVPPAARDPEGAPPDPEAVRRAPPHVPTGRSEGRRADRPVPQSPPFEPEPDADEGSPLADDDAPRAPRVRVKPLSPGAGGADAEPGEPSAADAPPRPRGGALSGLLRAARGWLGSAAERRRQAREPAPPDADDEPDWTRAWQGTEEDVGGPDEAAFDAAPYGEPEPRLDSPRIPRRTAATDDAATVAPTGPPAPRERSGPGEARPRPERTEPVDEAPLAGRRDAESRTGARGRTGGAPEPAAPEPAAPEPAAHGHGAEPHAAEPQDAEPQDAEPQDAGATERDAEPASNGPTLPSGVPIRAERFLGGDLRTRLLRFLASPDMPLIAKTELIAKRFDLDLDTARDMLEDVADDPPDGLRLTPVRDGAWRIERTGS